MDVWTIVIGIAGSVLGLGGTAIAAYATLRGKRLEVARDASGTLIETLQEMVESARADTRAERENTNSQRAHRDEAERRYQVLLAYARIYERWVEAGAVPPPPSFPTDDLWGQP